MAKRTKTMGSKSKAETPQTTGPNAWRIKRKSDIRQIAIMLRTGIDAILVERRDRQ